MASPRPSPGIGITAMESTPAPSNSRSVAGVLRQRRSERQQRLSSCNRGGVHSQMSLRRIVRDQHAGGDRTPAAVGRIRPNRRDGDIVAEKTRDGLARDGAGAQQHRAAATGQDGRFEPERRGAAIDDKIDTAGKVGLHMRCRGGRHPAGPIGGGRHHRLAERGQDIAGDRMVRRPHRNGVQPRGGKLSDRTAAKLGQHERQRSRPKDLGQLERLGVELRQTAGRCEIGHVGNQWIEGWPLLGGIKLRHRAVVGSIRAEAINRLGREGHEPTRRQNEPGPLDRRRARPRDDSGNRRHLGYLRV